MARTAMKQSANYFRLSCVLAMALLAGCQSGPRPRPIAAANPQPRPSETPSSTSPVRLASATEPLPPSQLPETDAAPASGGEHAEPVPTPVHEAPAPLQLSLYDAVEMGLAQNPDLIAQRYAEGVSEGALGVA